MPATQVWVSLWIFLEAIRELELGDPTSLSRFKSGLKEFENFTKAKDWLLIKARSDLRKVRWTNYKIKRLTKIK